jgi:hypothetical protein
VNALALAWIAAFADPEVAYWQVGVPLLLSGAGIALSVPAAQSAVLTSVSPADLGTASGDQHLAGSFDLTTAPFARGLFLGDYQGLVAVGEHFSSVFVQTNCDGARTCAGNRTDVLSTRFPAALGGTTRTGATAGPPDATAPSASAGAPAGQAGLLLR